MVGKGWCGFGVGRGGGRGDVGLKIRGEEGRGNDEMIFDSRMIMHLHFGSLGKV